MTFLARLITITSYAQKGIYAITGTKSRETGTYTKPVRNYGNAIEAKKRIDTDRYHILNLTNLAYGTKRTVEIRAFSGSTSATKVVGWIQVCLGLVERALNDKRNPTWEPKAPTGGWAMKGEGASETERLISFLAWTDAQAKAAKTHAKGWIHKGDDGITKDAVLAEFRRLARKYDADPTPTRD
jgi:hypothetical protein